jgi:hypothetical protein
MCGNPRRKICTASLDTGPLIDGSLGVLRTHNPLDHHDEMLEGGAAFGRRQTQQCCSDVS